MEGGNSLKSEEMEKPRMKDFSKAWEVLHMRQWLNTCVDESKEMRHEGRRGKNSGQTKHRKEGSQRDWGKGQRLRG